MSWKSFLHNAYHYVSDFMHIHSIERVDKQSYLPSQCKVRLFVYPLSIQYYITLRWLVLSSIPIILNKFSRLFIYCRDNEWSPYRIFSMGCVSSCQLRVSISVYPISRMQAFLYMTLYVNGCVWNVTRLYIPFSWQRRNDTRSSGNWMYILYFPQRILLHFQKHWKLVFAQNTSVYRYFLSPANDMDNTFVCTHDDVLKLIMILTVAQCEEWTFHSHSPCWTIVALSY